MWYRSDTRSGYQSRRVPAARIKRPIWIGCTKKEKLGNSRLRSCWNRHAPRSIPNVPRERNVLDTIYSGSHAPVPTSIERVTSVLRRGQKKKGGEQWDEGPGGAICQVARERLERTDVRTDDSRRSLARCTRWRSTETLATSLVTKTFAKW